jgi:hypothetical protein
MSIIDLIKSMHERATRLEAEAAALRTEAGQLRALFLGETDPVTEEPAAPVPEAPKKKMPTADEIRAMAAKYNVDVSDLCPTGKRPTDQQKEAAAKRIFFAKQAMEVAQKDEAARQPAPKDDAATQAD